MLTGVGFATGGAVVAGALTGTVVAGGAGAVADAPLFLAAPLTATPPHPASANVARMVRLLGDVRRLTSSAANRCLALLPTVHR